MEYTEYFPINTSTIHVELLCAFTNMYLFDEWLLDVWIFTRLSLFSIVANWIMYFSNLQCEEEIQSLKSSLQSKELALKNAQMSTEEQLRRQYEKLSQVRVWLFGS